MKNTETRNLLSGLLVVINEGAKIAKQYHRALFDGNVSSAQYKDNETPITVIDKQINQLFATFATERGLGLIGEEGNVDTDNEYQLLVDPIDGTGAFMRGAMNTSTIIASVLKMEGCVGTPILAIIHEPICGHTWCALEGNTHYLRGTWPAKSIYTINNAPKPWLTTVCAWPGAGYNMQMVKSLTQQSKAFQEQSMGAIGICGGLIARGIISLAAFPPGSAVETTAMQLIVDNAGGYTCNLLGEPLGQYELGELWGKRDFLLPNGAIFAADKMMADALLAIVEEANTSS